MKEPEFVTATQQELDEILLRAKPALLERQYRLLEGVLTTLCSRCSSCSTRRPPVHAGEHHFQRVMLPLDHLAQRIDHVFVPSSVSHQLTSAGYCDRTSFSTSSVALSSRLAPRGPFLKRRGTRISPPGALGGEDVAS